MTVEGTKAIDLFPAVQRGMPEPFVLSGDIASWRQVSLAWHSWTFAPTCDAASGNILMLKAIGKKFELELSPSFPNLLFLPDLCQAHGHQRGKLSVKPLKGHCARHFSAAKLLRQKSILDAAQRAMDKKIRRVRRRLGQPPSPEHQARLRSGLNILFNLDNGDDIKGNEFRKDLKAMLEMVNDDVTSDVWQHFCCTGLDGQPCCPDEEACAAKLKQRVGKVMFGRAQVVPGEGKWTYMMKSFKLTLLRHIIHRAGVIDADVAKAAGPRLARHNEFEGEGEEDFESNAVRLGRAVEYFENERNAQELTIHVMYMTICDELFYSLLGGTDKTRPPIKVAELLHKQRSPISMC